MTILTYSLFNIRVSHELLTQNGCLVVCLIADVYKDESKQELIAVCIRYVHRGMLKKRAIGFVATVDMTAAGISKKILEVIEPLQLDPCLCVGFSFDGASIMSENQGGVHVLLKRTFPQFTATVILIV